MSAMRSPLRLHDSTPSVVCYPRDQQLKPKVSRCSQGGGIKTLCYQRHRTPREVSVGSGAQLHDRKNRHQKLLMSKSITQGKIGLISSLHPLLFTAIYSQMLLKHERNFFVSSHPRQGLRNSGCIPNAFYSIKTIESGLFVQTLLFIE